LGHVHGIRKVANNLIYSYLSNRQQCMYQVNSKLKSGMTIALHRNRNRIFFPKKSLYISHRHPQKHCISKLNKNNLPLFQFFNKLPTVLYPVASCDCFVIIIFMEKEKFQFGYDLLCHSAFRIVHEIVIEASKKFISSKKRSAGSCRS